MIESPERHPAGGAVTAPRTEPVRAACGEVGHSSIAAQQSSERSVCCAGSPAGQHTPGTATAAVASRRRPRVRAVARDFIGVFILPISSLKRKFNAGFMQTHHFGGSFRCRPDRGTGEVRNRKSHGLQPPAQGARVATTPMLAIVSPFFMEGSAAT
jgi:hypothetical protein